jgi:hypothetical protein
MYQKLFHLKFLILKPHSGSHATLFKDFGMVHGYTKETYTYMVGFNYQVLHFPLIPSSKSIWVICLRITLICITKLLILTPQFLQ